jgi:hypothetical protein
MAASDTEKTYAILYLRPDGWWIAGEGWINKLQARVDAANQLRHNVRRKVVLVGGKPYTEAKELEAREAA